jgi:hypothetical protein
MANATPAPPFPQPQDTPPRKPRTGLKVLGGIVGGVFVFFLGVAAGGGGGSTAASATKTVTVTVPGAGQTITVQPTTTQPAGPKTTVSDGTFHVGDDITAGRWKTDGPSADSVTHSCYWERTKDDSGSFSSIIANDNISGPTSLTVNAGEFVKFSGGCTWSHA